jgi:two-component system KDP operon response regulator KdpE
LARLLIVDDEQAVLRSLGIGLRAKGYDVVTANTGQKGLSEVALCDPDVVVLDLGLPDLDGVEVCRLIRTWSEVPILVLSAHGAEETKVAALDCGADDFVTKPFGMAEFQARLRVALRRARRSRNDPEEPVVKVGSLEVDRPRRRVSMRGEAVELTAREFDFLSYLASNAGKVVTHATLLRAVWGEGYGTEIHYLRVYANRLRTKLGDPHGNLLRTSPGVGYQLLGEDPPGG